MITNNDSSAPVSIHESKIIHKRSRVHPFANYVTEEAVSLKFNVKREEIHRIELWDNLVYVYAGKLSRFVSYADFPPIFTDFPAIVTKEEEEEDEETQKLPVIYWGERLEKLGLQDISKKQNKKEQLLNWWCKYYQDRISETRNKIELRQWGLILAQLKPILPPTMVDQIRNYYRFILEQGPQNIPNIRKQAS